MPALRRELGLWDLVLFNIAAVVGIRWLAAAAHVGPAALSLWALAALFFFLPSALAVSRLASVFPQQGGIYVWTRHAFGDWHAFLCGWCYWLSNLFYIPNLLLSGIGMAVFALGAAYTPLADNRAFVVAASLVVLWSATAAHLVGLKIGKWTGDLGGLATYAAGALLAALGAAVWLMHGPATEIRLLPEWNWERVNFWSQIAFAFGGLELGAILGGEIRDPKRTVPRAALLSGAAITTFYIVGTVAILAVLPPENVNLLTGLTQAGAAASGRLGLGWIGPLFALLIAVAVTGQLGAWLGGSARVPFVIGLDRYLPAAFARLHPRWRTPHVALLFQGAACTAFLLLMQLGQSLRAGYQLLVDMTVITYFIPFLYLFAAAWKYSAGRTRLPALSGLAVTLAAIAFSFVPPAGAGAPWLFQSKLAAGALLLIAAARHTFTRKR